MEPTSLRNSFSPRKVSPSEIFSPTKEYLNLGTPTPRRERLPVQAVYEHNNRSPDTVFPVEASTPVKSDGVELESQPMTPQTDADYQESNWGSPATPYFLHPQQLVQHTCPPKQSQQLFFPVSGRIQDEPSESLRQRLTMARRKSLQWAPRTSSPLARTHSYQ